MIESGRRERLSTRVSTTAHLKDAKALFAELSEWQRILVALQLHLCPSLTGARGRAVRRG